MVCKGDTGTQFACFTSTKVQLLTQKAIHPRFLFSCADVYDIRPLFRVSWRNTTKRSKRACGRRRNDPNEHAVVSPVHVDLLAKNRTTLLLINCRVLTYADVCWRILTYTDECWSSDKEWRHSASHHLLSASNPDVCSPILTYAHENCRQRREPLNGAPHSVTQFTQCFTGTKVQILTIHVPRRRNKGMCQQNKDMYQSCCILTLQGTAISYSVARGHSIYLLY